MRLSIVLAMLAAGCDGGEPAAAADLQMLAADLSAAADGTSCAEAIDLTHLGQPWSGSTVGAPSLTVSMCDPASSQSPALYFRYQVGAVAVDLIADVVVDPAAPWDALATARDDCSDPSTESACADAGGSQHLEVLGATGTVAIVVGGTTRLGNADRGGFTVSAHTRAVVAAGAACDPAGVTSRCGGDARCVAGRCTATSAAAECAAALDLTPALDSGGASASGRFLVFEPGYYAPSCTGDSDPGWPEQVYRFTVAQPSLFVATTDFPNQTDFDTALYLRQDSCDGAEVSCDDDISTANGLLRSRIQTMLLAGTYYLFVDTATAVTYGSFNAETRSFLVAASLMPLPTDGGAD
jgi:hypothetical protein